MGTSTEHQFPNERSRSECFHAEYFGFAQTDRTDNIPPNLVDEIVLEFLSINSSLVRSQSRCKVSLVLPEVCPGAQIENGLNLPLENERVINFRWVKDLNKSISPLGVLLKIERTFIEVCVLEPAIKVLTHPLSSITFCSQGIAHPEYFGFIATSPVDHFLNSSSLSSPSSNCHVFRCSSEVQVAQVMQALKSAFNVISSSSLQSSSSSASFLPTLFHPQQTPLSTHGCTNFSSETLAPIERLNGLCKEIQTKSFSEAHEILQRFIEVHHADKHKSILRRVQEAGCETLQETNEIIVSCLLRLAEDKPPPPHLMSLHPPQTCPPPALPLQGLSMNLISSFPPPITTLNSNVPHASIKPPFKKNDSSSMNERMDEDDKMSYASESVNRSRNQFPENSPMRTMFANVGNSLGKSQSKKPKPTSECTNNPKSRQMAENHSTNNSHHHHQQQVFPPGSWRFGILNKVVNSSKAGLSSVQYARYLKDLRQTPAVKINYLWRKAIVDTMYLIKLNRGRSEDDEDGNEVPSKERQVRQMKADYDEITPCLVEVTKVWEEVLAAVSTKHDLIVNHDIIISAMRAGVPRNRRGDIWIFLMNQKLLELSKLSPGPSSSSLPSSCTEVATSYKDLLKLWTQHQHAILIDLGRTFPGHPYFSTQLGSGQISLFNILKAYSLLDTEVGYCQGISFVAGILLLHIPEDKAFDVLKFMMFTLNFRRQYCPDMVHLQIQLYQLSRLLHDLHKDLYNHFDRLEISPTLYAAPWFLTIFASQFPLGFVARVFDLIFLQGCEVVIKVAVVLLGNHKELIKQCDNFETVVDFLKTTLPEMSTIQMERIISQVFDLDISKQLDAYKIEYHVLREEMLALKFSNSKVTSREAVSIPGNFPSTNGSTADSKEIHSSILQPHHELITKLQELTTKNCQLIQQIKKLQSKLDSTKISSNNNNEDGVIILGQDRGQSSSEPSFITMSPSHLQDIFLYSSSVDVLLHQIRPYVPEELKSDLNKVISLKPKWMTSFDENVFLSSKGFELQDFVSSSEYAAPSHPPMLSIHQGSASSEMPAPLWPLSPLSDGGVGCYLDREVEDFISAGLEVSPSHVILGKDDEELTRNLKVQILHNKGQGASHLQRPSSNYY